MHFLTVSLGRVLMTEEAADLCGAVAESPVDVPRSRFRYSVQVTRALIVSRHRVERAGSTAVAPAELRLQPRQRKSPVSRAFRDGRYWARTSDPQLVELVLSQLS